MGKLQSKSLSIGYGAEKWCHWTWNIENCKIKVGEYWELLGKEKIFCLVFDQVSCDSSSDHTSA